MSCLTATDYKQPKQIIVDNIEWVADYRNDEGLRIRKDGNSPCMSARRHSENDISTMPPIIKVKGAALRGRKNKVTNKHCQNLELRDDDLANSITSAECDSLVKKQNKIRRLTPLECWRLQGFTDLEFFNAQKTCSDTQLYKQAGNTITVNVMMEIFKKIYENE